MIRYRWNRILLLSTNSMQKNANTSLLDITSSLRPRKEAQKEQLSAALPGLLCHNYIFAYIAVCLLACCPSVWLAVKDRHFISLYSRAISETIIKVIQRSHAA